MFIFPLMSVAERGDDMSQLSVTTATTEFVDNSRSIGKITMDNYSKLVSAIQSTGNAYDIEIEVKVLDENIGKIDAPISRKSDSIIEREISSLGDNAITHFEVISHFNNFTLVSFKLETGRTHQIRVHSKYISHPILGDTLYGKPSELIDRQALHACRVEFIHPIFKEPVSYTSSLPKDIQKILNIYNFKI